MVSLTYTSLTTLVNDTSIAAATAEAIIDQAIHTLNLYGTSISNMSGAAGSKTLTATSAEAGAILNVAVEIYVKDYKASGAQSDNVNVGPVGFSQSVSSGGGASSVHSVAKQAAGQLLGRSFARA